MEGAIEHTDLVSLTSFRILCDHSDSLYVTNRVLEDFSQRKQPWDERLTVNQWLLRRVVVLAKKRIFHQKLMTFLGSGERLFVQTSPKVDDVDDYITTQAWEIYCRTVSELTMDQRIVYALCEIGGLSEEETGTVAGIWPSGVRLCLEIARGRVKEELGRFGKVAEYDAYVGFLRRVKDPQMSCL